METIVKSKQDIDEVVTLLKRSSVVAFPTETVFGLGVIYNDLVAIDKLIKAKNRDMSKRFTLMLASKNDIEKYAYTTRRDQQIIEAFMPGDITVILKSKEYDGTIGIRVPNDIFVQSLISKCEIPLYVTSANISSMPSALTTDEVLMQLNGKIECVVDGRCELNEASSVVDLTGDVIKVLRKGRITKKMIEEVVG